MHTFMTLWYRLPMFAAAALERQAAARDSARMVSEKAAAMFEGALDAQIEALRIAGAAATGRLDFSRSGRTRRRDIAAAGLRPAFRAREGEFAAAAPPRHRA